ncbi:hypothetical protein [Candidatus Pantoea floridensis]|uniref:Uncharacterized protein n=1 Tax=Candidatus Pantoea floridensis TaxID=1938870 RepID=A0A286BSV0_9GAMM|nr:hypothetical protein [Pantoea floridensis]PIF23735.1 hypothetical protein BX596_3192 [Enterobacteriaceae bacterium JKS000233]SOD37188.1 hypothetical protein SAMN06273570_1514 [Pantoea floridensis]
MLNNIDSYKATGIFIIIERIYNRDVPNWHGIGSELVQIYKVVYQLYRKQDLFLDGERITPANASLWDHLKIFAGSELEQQNSKDNETRFALDYAGSEFRTTPLVYPGLNIKSVSTFLTSDHPIPTQRILAFGQDPIPDIKLYGRSDAQFVMANGGKDDPMAAARYDSNSGQLKLLDPIHQLSAVMRDITS